MARLRRSERVSPGAMTTVSQRDAIRAQLAKAGPIPSWVQLALANRLPATATGAPR
jgi:hypothetical protein